MSTWDQMTELEQLECMYWDAYKDAYGFRPRDMQKMTVEQLKFELQKLDVIISRSIDLQIQEELEAVDAFEDKVDNMLKTISGSNRKGVINFMMGEKDCLGNEELFKYYMGLPFTYKLF